MFIATIATVVGAGSTLYNAYRGSRSNGAQGSNTGPQAAAAADPFGQFREGFGQQLSSGFGGLTRFDPSQIQNDPAYQFQMQQGTDAINKGDAASGMLGSGNRGIELEKYGQGLASNFTQQQFGRNMSILQMLGQFSGATTGNPGAAGQAYTQGGQNAFNNGQTNQTNLGYGLNQLPALGKTIGNWFNGGGQYQNYNPGGGVGVPSTGTPDGP